MIQVGLLPVFVRIFLPEDYRKHSLILNLQNLEEWEPRETMQRKASGRKHKAEQKKGAE